MTYFLRKLTKHLRGREFFYDNTFVSHNRNYERTLNVVVLYYLISVIFGLMESDWGWPNLMESQLVEVLWPFKPFGSYIKTVLVPFGFIAWIFGALISAARPDFFWARLIHFLGVFIIVGLRNSDSHFGHSFHAYMWTSMVLVFLPNVYRKSNNVSRILRHRYIQTFWSAQFIICVFYFMTGVWKIRSIGVCLVSPEMQCELSEKILTNLAAQELVQYRKFAPMSWVLFDYPWLGFFSYAWTIWIHMYSIHFALRPNLHVFFGGLRVIFHLGTLALFGINFAPFTLAAIFLYVFSPFSATNRSLLKELRDLPPFDFWIRRLKTKKKPPKIFNTRMDAKFSKIKMLFLILAIAIFSVELVNWTCFLVYSKVTGHTISDRMLVNRKEDLTWPLRLKSDPIFGSVFDNRFDPSINNYGFQSKFDFPIDKKEGEVIIGVFGGNIASKIGRRLEKANEDLLRYAKRAFSIPSETEVRFINYAINEFKQPQQFHTLSYFIETIDFAIILDGANDVSGNPFPSFPLAYPKYSRYLFNDKVSSSFEPNIILRLENRKQIIQSYLKGGGIWKFSGSLRLLFFLLDWLQSHFIQKLDSHFSLGGPDEPTNYFPKLLAEDNITQLLVGNWVKYAQLSADLLTIGKVPYFYFVEPNQYLDQSPQENSETSSSYYKEIFANRFKLLVQQALLLRERGYRICDFSKLFASNPDLYFQGTFTDISEKGEEKLIDSIFSVIQNRDFNQSCGK